MDAVEQPHRRLLVQDRRDVIDLEPAARAGGEQQRALRVLRVLPDVELVRVERVLVEQLRVGGVLAGDVVEAEGRAARRLALVRAVAAAVGVQDDEHVLRAPHAQLARGLLRVALERRAHLLGDERVRRVLRVDDEDAGVVGVVVLAVGAAADVDVALVDGDRGVHAAAHQRLVPDLRERARRVGLALQERADAVVRGCRCRARTRPPACTCSRPDARARSRPVRPALLPPVLRPARWYPHRPSPCPLRGPPPQTATVDEKSTTGESRRSGVALDPDRCRGARLPRDAG